MLNFRNFINRINPNDKPLSDDIIMTGIIMIFILSLVFLILLFILFIKFPAGTAAFIILIFIFLLPSIYDI